MPLFLYKAVGQDGEVIEAQREAKDEQSLVSALQTDGLMPITVVLASSKPLSGLTLKRNKKSSISVNDVSDFTKELATLLNAGLPLDRSLSLLVDLTDDGSQTQLMSSQILDKVRGGVALSQALEDQSGVFSKFYINMIRAGEAGGQLENVLDRLSEYLERSKELRGTVKTALIYPVILVTMAILSLMVLLTFVVPQFQEMFESAGQELPLPTQIVVGVSSFLQSYWWLILIVIFAIVMYLRSQLSDPVRRYVWDKRFLAMPYIGDLIKKIEVANFSRTLGTLLGNGVSLLSALSIVKETLNNQILAENVGHATENLKEGGAMSGPLIESALFPKMATQMIQLGEETGSLENMLERVALTYDKEIKVTIERMLTMLEPLLIVGLGLMIAGIIISILMAILSVNDLAF